MGQLNNLFPPAVSAVLLAFLVVLALLWFFLPFAIFGTKPKLDELLVEIKVMNRRMETILKTIEKGAERHSASSRTVNCALCGKEHSNTVSSCPFCGQKPTNR
jgi:hypothetical protein